MTSLRQSIEEYLAMRRSLGFKMREAARMLPDFAKFMERRAPYITQELAVSWAQRPTHTQPAHWGSRLSLVRQFARYRSASDPRTQIPMPLSPKHRKPCSLLSWVYYCLFGLLSVSGLRVGEASNLKLEDVDLNAGVLTVRSGKFGKDRFIPIHASTCGVLRKYIARRQRHWAARAVSSYLFVSSWGKRLDIGSIHRAFYARLSISGY